MKRHPIYAREGTTLIAECPVSFTTAALGGSISLPGLDGKPVEIKIPAGIQSGEQLRHRGVGDERAQRPRPRRPGRAHPGRDADADVRKEQKKLLEEFRDDRDRRRMPRGEGLLQPRPRRVRRLISLFKRSISSRIANSCANSSAAAWSSKLGSRGSSAFAAEFAARRRRCRTARAGSTRMPCAAKLRRALARRASASARRRSTSSSARAGNSATGFRLRCRRRSPASRRHVGRARRTRRGCFRRACLRNAASRGRSRSAPASAARRRRATPGRCCSARPAISPPTVPNASPKPSVGAAPLRAAPPVAELEGDVDEIGVVGQPDAVGAARCRSFRSAARTGCARSCSACAWTNRPSGSSIKVTCDSPSR